MFVTQIARRRSLLALLLVALTLTMIGATSADLILEVIPLPDGFQPEGIAAGTGRIFYVGSIPTGAVFRGDVQTGEGEILVPAQEGRSATGLKFDERTGLLFVAGGATGYAYVYNAETGENVAAIQLETRPSFINDVVITEDAAYFTNSSQRFLYKVPLKENGELPKKPRVEAIRLRGEYKFTPGEFNANGIAATPNGSWLIVVNTFEGALYRVDPMTGVATRINLRKGAVPSGDGILLQGENLYVVQNFLNQISVVELNNRLTAGEIERTITNELFRIPTTVARFDDTLCVVNARFDTPPTPETEYEVVCVPKR
jgi:hypothetical protein